MKRTRAGAKGRTARRRAPRETTSRPHAASDLVAQWPFPVAAALGSAVRATGIEREIRMRLPWTARNSLTVEDAHVRLRMTAGEDASFEAARALVAEALGGVAALPVLPSEAEDILSISAHERLKWVKDGRLASAGTRTVKMRGRSKAVTFHVFDPRLVEDALDRDLPALWREADAEAVAEARRRAAAKAALTRAAGKSGGTAEAVRPAGRTRSESPRPRLQGWESFETEGLLR